jgi:outer membrane protein, heavy metal efflux system
LLVVPRGDEITFKGPKIKGRRPGKSMRYQYAKHFLVLTVFAIIFIGCATYHKLPLNQETVSENLKPPSLEAVRIEAKSIKHPILKPIEFNLRDGLSPDEAAILAVVANPALRAIRDQKGIAAAQLLQAGILPNPQFFSSLDVPTGGNTQDTVNAFGLGLGWDITSLIARGARREAARSQAQSVDLDIAWKEWQVAQSARLDVYRLVFTEKELALARHIVKQRKENLAAVQQGFSIGAVTGLELDAAKKAFQEALNRVLILESEKEHERHALNQVLGMPPENKVPLQRDIRLSRWENLPTAQNIMADLEDRRLDLLALKKGYESQEAQVRVAILSQFPKINIGLNYARDVSDVITTGFAAAIDLPFFDRNQGRIALERAGRKQLFDEYIARVFEAHSKIATLISDMKFLKKQIEATEKSFQISTHLLETYKKALEEGNADILVYNTARDETDNLQLKVLQLNRDLSDMGIALEIAAGEYTGQANTGVKDASHD